MRPRRDRRPNVLTANKGGDAGAGERTGGGIGAGGADLGRELERPTTGECLQRRGRRTGGTGRGVLANGGVVGGESGVPSPTTFPRFGTCRLVSSER